MSSFLVEYWYFSAPFFCTAFYLVLLFAFKEKYPRFFPIKRYTPLLLALGLTGFFVSMVYLQSITPITDLDRGTIYSYYKDMEGKPLETTPEMVKCHKIINKKNIYYDDYYLFVDCYEDAVSSYKARTFRESLERFSSLNNNQEK